MKTIILCSMCLMACATVPMKKANVTVKVDGEIHYVGAYVKETKKPQFFNCDKRKYPKRGVEVVKYELVE